LGKSTFIIIHEHSWAILKAKAARLWSPISDLSPWSFHVDNQKNIPICATVNNNMLFSYKGVWWCIHSF
jgi:hypothetical protein